MLFGVIDNAKKDFWGKEAVNEQGPVCSATRMIATSFPDLLIACDVCLCEYTGHGHCGVPTPLSADNANPEMDNTSTLATLASAALVYAKAGAHMVCPSDMMDGRIHAIRTHLDQAQLRNVSIMAYTSKKASSMYAPFRDAVNSTFKGDRKRYQQPIGSIVHARQVCV